LLWLGRCRRSICARNGGEQRGGPDADAAIGIGKQQRNGRPKDHFGLAFRGSGHVGDVLALDVTAVAHSLVESREIVRDARVEKPDPLQLTLLSVRNERPKKRRRDRRATNEPDEVPPFSCWSPRLNKTLREALSW
jgi:hypothetical protein